MVGENCMFLHLQIKHEDDFVGKNYTQHFCNNTVRVHNNKFKKKNSLCKLIRPLISPLTSTEHFMIMTKQMVAAR